MSTTQIDSAELKITVIRGQVLGATVVRGYTKLSDLARISKPDIYDQKTNPTGTQRDLSPKHAREAYDYVKTRDLGYWPEVFLCARDKKVMKYISSEIDPNVGILVIDLGLATDPSRVAISRIDGNHRLHYADGAQSSFPAIEKSVSFCLAYNLNLEQEIILFRDINANQKAMSTSHLDNIEARLSNEERLKREKPDLYIAEELGRDPESPFYERVHQGGKKISRAMVPLRALHTGISYMRSKPSKLTALREVDAQYKVIKNYFLAIKLWQPQAWEEPSKYLLLRGAGLWAVCYIGVDVIDRSLSKSKFRPEDMYKILTSGKNWDWSNKGDFQGLGGQAGSVRISNKVTAEFSDESGISVKSLYEQIMKDE